MQYFFTDSLQKFAQQTVDAMSIVLDVNVTVVDANIRRIAGTGCFANRIEKYLSDGYVFRRVIATGETCFIENPGKTQYCEECFEKDICKEKATALVPIKIKNEIIGGIGIAATTEKEKNILIKNKKVYISYMEKMAELLAQQIISDVELNKSLMLYNNYSQIIGAYPYGIMTLDSFGRVIYYNKNAEAILDMKAEEIVGKQYTEKFSCEILEKTFLEPINYESVKIYLKINNIKIELILSVYPIVESNLLKSIVCFIERNKGKDAVINTMKDTGKYVNNNIQGKSNQIQQVISLINKIAPSNSTVLITGESGTGKEIFAKAIHSESNRSSGPFVAINCSAIPDNLLESELFGYSKGAFTSANTSGKMGKFELANKGTIFLDEIGDMPINLQAKLLRVLQEKKIERLGDVKSIDIDIRILAATNRDLKKMIEEKTFREDLYYRINIIPLHLPPLRERKDDVEVLANHFLSKYNFMMLKNVKGFEPETLSILNNYKWPGNIRELENVIEYAMNMENTEFIQPISLPHHIIDYNGSINEKIEFRNLGNDLSRTFDMIEKNKLDELLKIHGNSTDSKKIIAKNLNISLSTLYRKLKKHGELE